MQQEPLRSCDDDETPLQFGVAGKVRTCGLASFGNRAGETPNLSGNRPQRFEAVPNAFILSALKAVAPFGSDPEGSGNGFDRGFVAAVSSHPDLPVPPPVSLPP